MEHNIYSKQLKSTLCKEFTNGTIKLCAFAVQHNIPVKTFEKWVAQYRNNPLCFDTAITKAKFRTIKPQNDIFEEKTNYSNMTEKELRDILLERDIEIARLKKNYSVKITSEGKEFVTFSKKNTK